MAISKPRVTPKIIYQLSTGRGVVVSMLLELIVAACGSPKMDRPTNANRAHLAGDRQPKLMPRARASTGDITSHVELKNM
jgi:hypothetical protein